MIIVGVPLLLGPVAGPLFDRAIVGSASWRSPSRHRCERRNALRSSSSAPKNQSRRVPLSRSATSSFLFERRETVSLAARWAGFVSVDRPDARELSRLRRAAARHPRVHESVENSALGLA